MLKRLPDVAKIRGVALNKTAHPNTGTGMDDGKDGLWHGTAVGSGCARGKMCIIRSPAEGLAMAAGDVLVAPSTDPA